MAEITDPTTTTTTTSFPRRRCLITGSSDPGSIGYGVAVALIAQNLVSDIVLSGRDIQKVEAAIERLQVKATAKSIQVTGAVGDLSKPLTMQDLLKQASGCHSKGSTTITTTTTSQDDADADVVDDNDTTTVTASPPIDWLIISGCNGGSEYLGMDAMSDIAGYHLLYDVAVVSPMLLTTMAVEQYGTKSVVMVSSLASDICWPDTLPYNTAKAAQNTLTKNLAFRYRCGCDNNTTITIGARVNAVLPACIHTQQLNIMAQKKNQSVEQYAQLRAECHPLQRNGTIEEVAQAVLALVTNSFLTGVLLPVDGGLAMTNWFNKPKLLNEYQGK